MNIEVFFEAGEGYKDLEQIIEVEKQFLSKKEEIKNIIIDAAKLGFPVQVGHGIDVDFDDGGENMLMLKVIEIRFDKYQIAYSMEEWT